MPTYDATLNQWVYGDNSDGITQILAQFEQDSGVYTATTFSRVAGPIPDARNRLIVATFIANVVSGTAPTLSLKIQDSVDGSSFSDILGSVTPNLTAAGNLTTWGFSSKPFVRTVATIGGTAPSFTGAGGLIQFLRGGPLSTILGQPGIG